MLTRRRFLTGAAAAIGGAALGLGIDHALSRGAASVPAVALGAQPAGLPQRQHAWTATLALDSDGNPIPPRFDRLLFFDVRGTPTPACARLLEASLRTLERRYAWGPSGLLFTAGWGPAYFRRTLSLASPIPEAKALSDFELPEIDTYDLCLHLACDNEQRLISIEDALAHGAPLPGADGPLALSSALRWHETRTGFVGAGLPAAHQDVGGIPAGKPVSRSAPLFMGFKSSLRRNQASEDEVTHSGWALRAGHDHAGQLHATAAGRLVWAAEPSRARGAHVRAAGEPRAGGPLHHRRRKRPRQVRRSGQPLRGDRTLAGEPQEPAGAANR